MTYPATNSKEASELLIDVSNQMHEIVNEDAVTEITTESGNVPSVRKALADTFLFQDPIAWNQGSDETAFNQLRTFDGNIYWAPTATTLNPIPMGATPIGDSNWKLAPVDVSREWTLQELTRSQNEVIGGKIFPLDDSVLQNGDTVPVGTTHLRVNISGEPTIVVMSPIASGTVSLLTNTGATIGGSDVKFSSCVETPTVETMKSSAFPVGFRVKTLGYYEPNDNGGAEYVNRGAGWPITADGKVNHSGINGHFYELQYVDKIFVEQAGARKDVDDSSFTDALQAIIDVSGSPSNIENTNTIKIAAGIGTFYLKSPAYINSLDGLVFEAAGGFNTNIKVSPSFVAGAGTVPESFPDDGLSYTDSAMFVFARRRSTGLSSAFIVPGQTGDGAAWFYKISGFYIDAKGTNVEKQFDVIRAPEIANLWMQDIVGHYIRRMVNTDDNLGCYASTFDRVIAWFSSEIFRIKRGTSLQFNQCAANDCDFGWTTSTNYTTYNSCSADKTAINNFAWDIGGVGVTLNGCGCEYPYGGVWRSIVENSSIVVSGGFFLGGTQRNSPNNTGQTSVGDFGVTDMVLISNGANVAFNQALIRTAAQPPSPSTTTYRFDASVRDGAKVSISGNAEEGSFEYLQRHEWIKGADDVSGKKSKIDFLDNKPAFKTKSTSDFTVTGAGANVDLPFLSAETSYDNGYTFFDTVHGLVESSGDVTSYVAPVEGVYRIGINARFENVASNDYIFVQAGSQSTTIFLISDSDNIADVSYTEPFTLAAGEVVRMRYRKNSELSVMKSGAVFFGEMF